MRAKHEELPDVAVGGTTVPSLSTPGPEVPEQTAPRERGNGIRNVAFTCFVVLLVAAFIDPQRVGAAVVASVARVFHELNLRVLLGLTTAVLAARAWSLTHAAAEQLGSAARFGITRHWGGLGSGEGGWEIEPQAVHWAVRLLGVVGLSLVSVVLLVPALLGERPDDDNRAREPAAPTAHEPPAPCACAGADSALPRAGSQAW